MRHSRGLALDASSESMTVTHPRSTKHHLRALVVDDDEWARKLVQALLEEGCPDLEIELRAEPDCSGEFDLYFLDNDFNGRKLAAELAREIRSRQPDSLIVAFSATLDRDALKELLNAGCNGACDKSRPDELEQLVEIAREFVESQVHRIKDPREPEGVFGAIRSIRDLLREWNSRLESSTDRAPASGANVELLAPPSGGEDVRR